MFCGKYKTPNCRVVLLKYSSILHLSFQEKKPVLAGIFPTNFFILFPRSKDKYLDRVILIGTEPGFNIASANLFTKF